MFQFGMFVLALLTYIVMIIKRK
ncbi:putative holin-like toxin [Paenibacillus sp. YYML68]|nr:putative holin-like toxin [Paenibacillus sp. YYML68]